MKYNIGVEPLLQQGIPEPIVFGNSDNKLKRIVGKPNISDLF